MSIRIDASELNNFLSHVEPRDPTIWDYLGVDLGEAIGLEYAATVMPKFDILGQLGAVHQFHWTHVTPHQLMHIGRIWVPSEKWFFRGLALTEEQQAEMKTGSGQEAFARETFGNKYQIDPTELRDRIIFFLRSTRLKSLVSDLR